MQAIMCVDLSTGYSKNGSIPWSCHEDLEFFRVMTRGKILYCGKKTYPEVKRLHGNIGRTIVMACRDYHSCKFEVDNSVNPNAMCIGGGKLLSNLVSRGLIDLIWLCKIYADYECDQHLDFIKPYLTHRHIIGTIKTDAGLLEKSFIKIY